MDTWHHFKWITARGIDKKVVLCSAPIFNIIWLLGVVVGKVVSILSEVTCGMVHQVAIRVGGGCIPSTGTFLLWIVVHLLHDD